MIAVLTFLEVLGRLSLVATLLAVPHDARLAVVAALISGLASTVRAMVRGDVLARESRRAWDELLDGLGASDLRSLSDQHARPDAVAVLVDSVAEVALVRGTLVPEIVGQGITLAAVATFAVLRLPFHWILAGVALAAPVAGALRFSQRAQGKSQARALVVLNDVARDVRALIEAGLELRAHGAEVALDRRVRASIEEMSRYERRTQRLSAAFALLPSAIALALTVVPRRWLDDLAARSGWLDVGVIGGAGLTLAMGIGRALEGLAHAAPYRAAFRRVALSNAAPRPAARLLAKPLESLRLENVAVIHQGAALATPVGLDLTIERGGVALVGPNGSGKSSAILAALGLLPCASGTILANGAPLEADALDWIRSRVAFLPQRCHVSPPDTLAWHAELAGVRDRAALLRACRTMDLARVFDRGGADPLEMAIGTLSGGERQRFAIARALARRADVLVLDEPEVGLDARGRELLSTVLAHEARERAVLVVAHDASIVPASFRFVEVAAAEPKAVLHAANSGVLE